MIEEKTISAVFIFLFDTINEWTRNDGIRHYIRYYILQINQR